MDSILKILTESALSSFNVYQVFACTIWFFRGYVSYPAIIMVFLVFSLMFQVAIIRREQKKINQMADSKLVRVFRQKTDPSTNEMVQYSEEIDSTELVPGDVIEIEANSKVPCDLVVLEGQALIDESLLTGESVPMLKALLPCNDEMFDEENKENLICAGTFCLTSLGAKKGTRAKGMVYQVGFCTVKGQLIRAIMFNETALYQFEKDSGYFTLYLVLMSLVMMAFYYYETFSRLDGPFDFG